MFRHYGQTLISVSISEKAVFNGVNRLNTKKGIVNLV